jgi:hypothetical protein
MYFKATLSSQLYVMVGILHHSHVRIISLKEEVWAHTTSLTPPHLIEVPVQSQESERSCICVLGLSILSLFLRFYYIGYGFWNCSEGIVYFIFHFISKYLALMASHFSIKSLFAVLSANSLFAVLSANNI